MRFSFTENAWEDFGYWMDSDTEMSKRIRELLKDISRNPFTGLGKPEPLKHELQGYWSRRITGEHRLVYGDFGKKGVDQTCIVIQCRFHYDQ